jgi:hypothetical protein
MITSPKPPCNAEGTQSEGRARDLGQMGATNNRSIIKAGIPRRMPRPAGYLLIFCALAAKVLRVLLDCFSGVLVDDEVADCDPAIVAGVGALVLVVVILILSRWVRGCARLCGGHGVLSLGPCLGVLVAPPGLPTLATAVLSHVRIEESIHLG